MARRTTFTRADVVAAALRLLENEGTGAVTARRVADELGASTAPVYSNFANMEELVSAAMARAADLVLASCREPRTEDGFLDMGVGFVHFAVDHPQLFRAMYFESNHGADHDPQVMDALIDDLARHPVLGRLPRAQQEELLFQASIYTLGIATAVVRGMWTQPDMDTVASWLRSVGRLLARAALESAGLDVPEEMKTRIEDIVVPWRHCGRQPGEDDDDR